MLEKAEKVGGYHMAQESCKCICLSGARHQHAAVDTFCYNALLNAAFLHSLCHYDNP